MISRVTTVVFSGVETVEIDVQIQLSSGQPVLTIVGLGDKVVSESKERVRAAIHSLGLSLPPKRITINLSPADIPKEGSHFDLPIALCLLTAMEIIPPDVIDGFFCLGELSLDGSITHVNGVLPAAMAASAKDMGIICPKVNASEALLAGEDVRVLAPANLLQIINHFKGNQILRKPEMSKETIITANIENIGDICDVRGLESAKRALEICASGGHNMLMIGHPGTGKSMLSSRILSILPSMDGREMLEVAIIKSIAGELRGDKNFTSNRPYRDPHHSASLASMVERKEC